MEKFMQSENGTVMLEDMNFSDVFGGPPRWLSIQDMKLRYSFGETQESEEETVSAQWSSPGEKPVFGEEIMPRRQHHQGDDFFDDIFRGDESCNSPRRIDIRDRDSVFRSNPGTRILSPALPYKADPFATSSPTQFSLPAKLTKGLETPTIASHGQHKMDDSSTNGLSSPHSLSFLSRFSSPVFRSQDEYLQSPLSDEAHFNTQDSRPTVLTDQKENGENSKDRRNIDGFGKNFHFSIYKWAGREVPMLLPLVGRYNNGTWDGNKYDRSASSNGRIESRSSSVPKRQSMLAREPKTVKNGYEEDLIQSKEVTEEEKISIEYKELHETLEPKAQKSQSQISANNVASNIGVVTQKTQGQVKSVDEESSRSKTKPLHSFLRDKSDVQQNSDKKVLPKKKESLQSKQKHLHVLLGDEAEQQGIVPEIKQCKKNILNGIHRAKTLKKNEGKRILSNNGTVDKSNLQLPVVDPGMDLGENGVRGKVREYVQIFNQEADLRPKVDLQRRSRNSRDQKESAMDSNAENVKEEVNSHNVVNMPEASIKADKNLIKDEAQRCPPAKIPCYTNNHSTNQENGFLSDTPCSDSMTFGENADDLSEYDFLVQELSEDHEIVTESEDPNDTKAIDSKIRQWSFGKKGNIRSLLSTLQFVLWPESGWKPVPLANLIESNAVKRAYQKALLRLHPDKLQQKGVAFNQKYIAGKVFDILQEAWDQFNVLVPI